MKTIHIKNADDLLDLCGGYISYLPKDNSWCGGRPKYVRGVPRTHYDGKTHISFIHHNAETTTLYKEDLDEYVIVFSRCNPYNRFSLNDDYISELVFDIEY